ncbi:MULTISPECIES: hypothetical protein [Chryseobacterium]|uniref:Uncharacterized protein n=1 Tax=Chryseobacterium geocarposphaerae TaxID=1416776 RepID=A0ABU1LBF5_9FLAO|nr:MULTISPECIES: hypothetical protein [Chryseobacterium]MDR6404046.1 hypothetical protein [Chryseobacterium geocarposphaerae]MDR6698435.1 hypothetical protein [Chryseobacterium ginsenosidimutans]
MHFTINCPMLLTAQEIAIWLEAGFSISNNVNIPQDIGHDILFKRSWTLNLGYFFLQEDLQEIIVSRKVRLFA